MNAQTPRADIQPETAGPHFSVAAGPRPEASGPHANGAGSRPQPASRCRRRVRGSSATLASAALALTVLAAVPAPVRAQSAEEMAVVSVVETFFAGMLARDTALMRTTFDPVARLYGIATPQGGEPTARATPMDQFLAGVARGAGEGANERIYAPEVRIDGNLATVWTFYTLHVGERFVHCGMDAFQLLKLPAGWKIVAVADTRRTENCEPPGR